MVRRGFTLIELLIVVAIIAILAAIALPNFLEAQTRAKVSRVKAELRAIAVGIEMYRVDNNAYPLHRDTPSDITHITTPVAYLSSVPHDPFMTRDNVQYLLVAPFYEYQDLMDIYVRGSPVWGGGTWLRDTLMAGKRWSLNSMGPDKEANMAIDATLLYDPTNGTVSRGDIYIVGP